MVSEQQIKDWAKLQVDKFEKHIDELTEGQSGMRFRGITKLTIHFGKTNNRFAGSYIPTPQELTRKLAIHNIKNDDDECIKWCLCSHKYYDTIKSKDKNQPKYFKKYINEIIEPKDQKYPIDIQSDIPKFEKLNKAPLSIEEAQKVTQEQNFEQTRASKLLFGDVKQKEGGEKGERNKKSSEEKKEREEARPKNQDEKDEICEICSA